MQLRMNEVNVFECPKYLTDNPSELDHVQVNTPLEGNEDMLVSLSLKGVISYFHTRKTSIHEYELAEDEGRSYDLTYDSPEWKPHSETYNNQEIAAQNRLELEDRGLRSYSTKHKSCGVTKMDT